MNLTPFSKASPLTAAFGGLPPASARRRRAADPTHCKPRPGLWAGTGWLGLCLLMAWLGGGCSSTRLSGPDALQAPVPPIFLTGPAAVILTNATGFSAQASLQTGLAAKAGEVTSGDLLVRGGHLLYAPTGSQRRDKRARRTGIHFVWDTPQNHGWVLSEVLQGYAPIGSGAQITNVTVSPSPAAPEKIEGHLCELQDVAVTLDSGVTAVYRVWRAKDLNGLPLQITSLGSTAPLLLKLSKPRLENPPAELFQPPDGFTRFSSPEALVTELVTRQHNLKHKSSEPSDESLENRPPGPR